MVALWAVVVVMWGYSCIVGGGGDIAVFLVVAWLHCHWWWDSVIGRSIIWHISVVETLL
jgi:hypothetical protein